MKQRLDLVTNRGAGEPSQANGSPLRRTSWVVSLACLAGLLVTPGRAQSPPPQPSLETIETYEVIDTYEVAPPPPDGAIPVPSYGSTPPSAAGSQPLPGQQYVVFVNGTSDLVLEQVRLVEPAAFRTNHQGQTVIQAGRFNSPQNAEQLINQLAQQGISSRMAEVGAAVPYYAQAPVQSPNIYAANGDLPPLPTGTMPPSNPVMPDSQPVPELPAMPPSDMAPQGTLPDSTSVPPVPGQGSSVEFGQELTYSVPPNPNAYPVDTTPPGTAAVVPSSGARISAPYYVVIPTPEGNLPELSTQIIQLGTPADRVQQRLTPRGPHVAVGPFEDRGLAFQWNRFYREAGIGNSRVYYNP
jgi:hypothetical protein